MSFKKSLSLAKHHLIYINNPMDSFFNPMAETFLREEEEGEE